MNHYETVFILTPVLSEPQMKEAVEKFKQVLAKFGAEVVNEENFEALQGFHAGWRKSGIGGADGKHGLEEYLQTQLVYLETKG